MGLVVQSYIIGMDVFSRITLDPIEKTTIFFLSSLFNSFNSLYAIKQFSHNGEHMDTKSMERNKSLTKILLYLFQKFQIQLHFDIKACNQRIVGNVLAWQINDPSNIQYHQKNKDVEYNKCIFSNCVKMHTSIFDGATNDTWS